MDQLQRTQSRESARTNASLKSVTGAGTGAHSLSSASSGTSTSRKARSAESETTSSNVERPALSMPPPATRTVSRNLPSRRLSKASDSLLLLSPGATGIEAETSPLDDPAAAGVPASAQSLLEGTYMNTFLVSLLFRIYNCQLSGPRIIC